MSLDYALLNQMGASFTVPVLIWIMVTFRQQDAAIIGDGTSPSTDAQAGGLIRPAANLAHGPRPARPARERR